MLVLGAQGDVFFGSVSKNYLYRVDSWRSSVSSYRRLMVPSLSRPCPRQRLDKFICSQVSTTSSSSPLLPSLLFPFAFSFPVFFFMVWLSFWLSHLDASNVSIQLLFLFKLLLFHNLHTPSIYFSSLCLFSLSIHSQIRSGHLPLATRPTCP